MYSDVCNLIQPFILIRDFHFHCVNVSLYITIRFLIDLIVTDE